MFLTEDVLHYVIRFIDRYDIQTKEHQKALKEFREISNHLIENLYKPDTINVIRSKKTKE